MWNCLQDPNNNQLTFSHNLTKIYNKHIKGKRDPNTISWNTKFATQYPLEVVSTKIQQEEDSKQDTVHNLFINAEGLQTSSIPDKKYRRIHTTPIGALRVVLRKRNYMRYSR